MLVFRLFLEVYYNMNHLEYASNVMRLEPTHLMKSYFSEENVDKIQNLLINSVKQQINMTISKQSYQDLLNIMMFVYEAFIQTRPNVKKLNEEVLRITVPMVSRNVLSHIEYTQYIQKPRVPIKQMMSTTTKGADVIESNRFI